MKLQNISGAKAIDKEGQKSLNGGIFTGGGGPAGNPCPGVGIVLPFTQSRCLSQGYIWTSNKCFVCAPA